jgi:hypothetical protein
MSDDQDAYRKPGSAAVTRRSRYDSGDPERNRPAQRRSLEPGKRALTDRLSAPAVQMQRAAPLPTAEREAPGVDWLGNLETPERGVQRKATEDRNEPGEVHELAQAGISGAATTLPHAERILQAFGRHDVSDVVAHVDDDAADAASAMGAEAYATGNHVAFAGTPTLHTAAHEAAHVVQQRGGVQLAGGVGAAGDGYEQQADAVADAVVRGESAEPLLDQTHPGGTMTAMPVQREEADVPDVSAGEIELRRVWDLKETKVGPVKANVSFRLKGSLKERAADSQTKGTGTKAGFGNRKAVVERRTKAEKVADQAITECSASIRTSLVQISDPEPLELLDLPGVNIVLKRDIKALEAKLDTAGDIDVSALTITFAGEANLEDLLDGLITDEFPWDIHGSASLQLEIKVSAEMVSELLRLRKATKDLEDVVATKSRHAKTTARIKDVEAELAERKAKKVPRTYPEIYDRTHKLEAELRELRKNETKLGKLSRKADEALGRAKETITAAKAKLGKRLGHTAEKALGKAAKEALEKGIAKVAAKFIPVVNAVSTAQDIIEVAEFLASVDWEKILDGGTVGGDSGRGTEEESEDGAEGSGGDESDVEGAVGEGPDGGAPSDLTDPVVDPFLNAPHHPAAQKVVDGMLGGGVVLGQADHELIDWAIPKDLSDEEIAQVIAVMYATTLASDTRQSADDLLDELIGAVQRVRSGEPVPEPEPREETPAPETRERATRRRKADGDEKGRSDAIDIAPALVAAFRFDRDEIVAPTNPIRTDGVAVLVTDFDVLTQTYSEAGQYAEIEVAIEVVDSPGTVRLVTHVPSQPAIDVSRKDETRVRIVISEDSDSTRTELPPARAGGE